MRRTRLWSTGGLLLLVVLGMLCAITCSAAEKAYNGHWWLSVSNDEHDGFLNGYADCYFNDYRGPESYWVNSPTSQKAITKFYIEHPADRPLVVTEVFQRLPKRAPVKPRPGGYYYKGRHGFYDGQYWGVLGDGGQLGYVEGYLWCWKNCLHSKGATFSKSPKDYVALINKWYGINPKTGINADREPAKIADVLYKFRDHRQPERRSKK